jgi:hypothetical protein
MPIPGFENAVIEPAKLRDYVLSRDHPIGRYKAVVFGKLGYTKENWEDLDRDIREQILPAQFGRVDTTPFGKKYVITGVLKGPSGVVAAVVTVWIVKDGEEIPTFITIYPLKGPYDI